MTFRTSYVLFYRHYTKFALSLAEIVFVVGDRFVCG
jgi:hypothetical protein